MIEFFMIAGMQITNLVSKLPFSWSIDQSRDLCQALHEVAATLEETVIEGVITGNQILFGMTYLRQEDLGEAFFFIDAGGIDGKDAVIKANEPVESGDGVEPQHQRQHHESALSKNYSPEYGQAHHIS